ncbi:MAG TPA: LuxR C-terminal-related transcriptional regulator [Candidatus Elarobacter sp.]
MPEVRNDPQAPLSRVPARPVLRVATHAGTSVALIRMQARLVELAARMEQTSKALAEVRAMSRARSARRPSDVPHLTARERQILRLIAEGKDNAQIGHELHFALGTIKLHVRQILEALDCPTRAAAAVRAVRLGLV